VVRALTRCALLCATSGKESSMPGSLSDGPFVSPNSDLSVVSLSVSGGTGDIDFNLSRLLGAELVACRFRHTESRTHWMRLHCTIILLLALLGSVHGFNKFLRRHQNQLKNTIMSTSAIHTVRLQHPGTCSGMCSFLSLFLEHKLR
jgi:hypothetical protein